MESKSLVHIFRGSKTMGIRISPRPKRSDFSRVTSSPTNMKFIPNALTSSSTALSWLFPTLKKKERKFQIALLSRNFVRHLAERGAGRREWGRTGVNFKDKILFNVFKNKFNHDDTNCCETGREIYYGDFVNFTFDLRWQSVLKANTSKSFSC
ncbi:hypothetical protein EVAR_31912_1 [Eumeta japonica]|uniref:Uncharacterized protein n=1 Tax=Eumeta variegata TaxID=151549 RepID=A0A4C1XNS9_EUMVA|nr:hypothetical protein EVAR_31912_1 [Eumeta japonica]